jgi:hypothetical protein
MKQRLRSRTLALLFLLLLMGLLSLSGSAGSGGQSSGTPKRDAFAWQPMDAHLP